jgi:hypothetical protein
MRPAQRLAPRRGSLVRLIAVQAQGLTHSIFLVRRLMPGAASGSNWASGWR